MSNQIKLNYTVKDKMDTKELSSLVDEEVEAFNLWFMEQYAGASSLAVFERSVLKTYLMWKLGAKA